MCHGLSANRLPGLQSSKQNLEEENKVYDGMMQDILRLLVLPALSGCPSEPGKFEVSAHAWPFMHRLVKSCSFAGWHRWRAVVIAFCDPTQLLVTIYTDARFRQQLRFFRFFPVSYLHMSHSLLCGTAYRAPWRVDL